jgi:hypothetical protein
MKTFKQYAVYVFSSFVAITDQIMVFFWVLHHVVINVVGEHTASIFIVTELVKMDAEMIWSKKCVSYVGQFDGLEPITGTEGSKRQWALSRTVVLPHAIQVQITLGAA